MQVLTPVASLSDHVHKAFFRGDDNATAKLAELKNVKVIEHAYDAFMRGDVATLLNSLDDDIDWHIAGPDTIPFAGQCQGKLEVAQALQRSFATVDSQMTEIRDVIAQGDTVTVIGHERGQCKTNGNDYECFWIHVFTFRESKIAKFREYLDTAALSDALAGK